MTPTLRLWLSEALGFATIVLSLTEVTGLDLELVQKPMDTEPRAVPTTPAAPASASGTSSGLFAGETTSLWSGWSASWSDAEGDRIDTVGAKLSCALPPARLENLSFAAMQREIRILKAESAKEAAAKAKRRAPYRAKAYGTLVWKVLRRAQRNPEATLSLIPRDALRIIVREVVAAETERLMLVYSTRLAAGAPTEGELLRAGVGMLAHRV